jgi:hypothetical protein
VQVLLVVHRVWPAGHEHWPAMQDGVFEGQAWPQEPHDSGLFWVSTHWPPGQAIRPPLQLEAH